MDKNVKNDRSKSANYNRNNKGNSNINDTWNDKTNAKIEKKKTEIRK